jgi:hypothetical protein
MSLGYPKGADIWHVANALFVAPDGRDLTFLTLDPRQQEVATALGSGRKAAPKRATLSLCRTLSLRSMGHAALAHGGTRRRGPSG